MDDKTIMENLLLTTKGVCDLYLHGTIESATANVNGAFKTALQDSLCLQDDIYKKMSAKGWYPAEQAEQSERQAEICQRLNDGRMKRRARGTFRAKRFSAPPLFGAARVKRRRAAAPLCGGKQGEKENEI